MRERLRHCPDIERALTRLSLGRGGPRDLAALRRSLGETAALRDMLAGPGLVPLPELLAAAQRGLGEHGVLVDRLGRALAEELPLFARDGGFIAAGYSGELDEWRRLRDESRRTIAALQAHYAAETAVAALKIRHNNVIGYYIEVSANHAGKLGPEFIHRQTMAGAQRYTTAELAELETKIASAAERALALELRLYDDLVGEVMARRAEIADGGGGIGEPRCRGGTGRARGRGRLGAAGGRGRHRLRDRGRAPPDRRGRARGVRRRRRLCRQRLRAGRGADLACHRPQHGREEHLFAAERADRDPGADRVPMCRRGRHGSASSTACSAGSVLPTTWRAAARPLWSRWSRPRRS